MTFPNSFNTSLFTHVHPRCTPAQFCALAWYTLSFIPYGRDMVWGCLSRYLPAMPATPAFSSGISGGIIGDDDNGRSNSSGWGGI
jgi:hypothetical protein